MNSGLIDANPCKGISKVFQNPRKPMPTLTPNQLPELMNKLTKASISLQTRLLDRMESAYTRPAVKRQEPLGVKLTLKQTLADPSRTDEET